MVVPFKLQNNRTENQRSHKTNQGNLHYFFREISVIFVDKNVNKCIFSQQNKDNYLKNNFKIIKNTIF